MELYKYAKSFLINEKEKHIWTSGFLFFVKDKEVILDKAFIILGDIPIHYYSYYCNFSNWQVEDGKLYYKTIPVNKDKVYLHLKRGISRTELNWFDSEENRKHWNNFVSHPNDKVFRHIEYQLENKIKLIDLRGRYKNFQYTITDMNSPLFNTTQYYGNGIDRVDQALFSSLKVELIE